MDDETSKSFWCFWRGSSIHRNQFIDKIHLPPENEHDNGKSTIWRYISYWKWVKREIISPSILDDVRQFFLHASKFWGTIWVVKTHLGSESVTIRTPTKKCHNRAGDDCILGCGLASQRTIQWTSMIVTILATPSTMQSGWRVCSCVTHIQILCF